MFKTNMVLLLIIHIVCLFAVSQSRSRINCVCGQTFLNRRIWKGKFAIPHQYPWQVALIKIDKQICGGTVLNERWVLTASHCLQNVTTLTLFLNYGAQKKLEPLEKRGTKKIICHEYFSGMETLDNDIGLVQNNKKVPLNEFIMPACLPSMNMPFPSIFEASGWGLAESMDYPDNLKYTLIPLRSDDHCENWWGDLYNRVTKFCAGFETGTCSGDSGGPVVSRVQGLYFVEGIVSFGYDVCGFAAFPPVYTRVRYYMDWISANMEAADYCEPLQE